MSVKYRRVLLKLSGEALAGKNSHGVDPTVVRYIAEEIREICSLGVELGIVVGGGNFYRGLAGAAQGIPRVSGDLIGMLATVMNSIMLKTWLEKSGVTARVFSALDVQKAAEPFVAEKVVSHLRDGGVAIFAAGTGNPFFTTDTAAALRCAEIEAQVLLKATKVDGVYDRDPEKDSEAVKFDTITHSEALNRNLKVMDLTAFSLCMENSIPIVVFKLMEKGNLRRCIEGEPVGSIIKKEE